MTKRTHSLPHPALAAVAAVGAAAMLTACGTTPGAFSIGSEGTSESLPPVAWHATADHCDGRLGEVSVDGDVTVPAGGTCELVGTTVEGNVSVGPGGRLYVRGADVDGDIEGHSAAVVDVAAGTDVGGNLQLESGVATTIRDSHVDGDLRVEDQNGGLTVAGDNVGGNVELEHNHGTGRLSDTRVGGDLACRRNTPALAGGGNTVSGERKEQCRHL